MPRCTGRTWRGERELADDVVTEVVIDDHTPPRAHRSVLRMSWQRDDPLAVRLRVVAEPAHPALPQGSWVVLRDFLRYGVDTPTGDGDVRIRPDGDAVVLELKRRARPYRIRVPAREVVEFLDATERLVPAGEERSEAALDALIDRLLRS